MSAPIEAYHTEEFHTTDTVVVNSYPIAKFTDNVAVLKSRFYLDWLLRIADGTDNEWGFIGGCTVGSDNYNMHTRGVMTFKGDSDVYYIDAGLNTKGVVDDTPYISEYNLERFIIDPFSSTSAYYVHGECGVEINNGSGWIRIKFEDMLPNTSITTTQRNIAEYMDYGETMSIRTYHYNDEGVTYGEAIDGVIVQAGLLQAYYSNTYGSQATAPTVNRYYTFRDVFGGGLYYNQDATTVSNTGYFVDPVKGVWYYFNGTIVSRTGLAEDGYWDSGDPANSRVRNFYGYTTSVVDICTKPLSPAPTCYLSVRDGKYYTDAFLTTYVTDGYYVNDLLGTRDWFHIVSGEEVDRGFCYL